MSYADVTYADLTYAVEGRVATITLNRPEAMNTARVQTHDELVHAFGAADADDAVRAVIVTGAGRAFCAGTDLSGGFDLPTGGDPVTGAGVPPDVGGASALAIYRMRKPVIGAINGVAVGFGSTVLLPMDYRVAVDTARFGFVFARRGIMAESCSSWFLPRLVGIATALDWMLSGRIIPAGEALAKGLVNETVSADQVLPRARAIANEIATHTAPGSIAVSRQLLWRMLGASSPETAHDYESRALAALLAHPDSREGVRSFMEKRAPRFEGRTEDTAFMDSWDWR